MANVYKNFKNIIDDIKVSGYVPQQSAIKPPNLGSTLSRRFDEPTYPTFRVMFGQNSANMSGATNINTDYDKMPHPLFINQKVDALVNQNAQTSVEYNRLMYSTRDYLRDSNEFTRAEMLNEFITVWNNLQTNHQWYFQSIEGLKELLEVKPERGKRVGKDVRLTFNMLEGIDHRISYLLNLYRKIAWDDTYQRWVLPDMMRYFDIQIIVTEYRTFHMPFEPKPDDTPLYLTILNDILPSYLISCEMCEFDINSIDYSYRGKLSVSGDPEMANVSFKVKVGNVNEVMTYPLFSHFIFDDNKLNGQSRSKEKGVMKDMNGKITNPMDDAGNPIESDYISTKDGDARYAALDRLGQDTFFQEDHISGRPFYEAGSYYSNLNNSNKNYSINLNMTDPIQPHTWVGNALNFGKAFATNFVTQKIDQAKMTSIPGLGFSFNEAYAAIESKDFFSVLGLVRKAISQSIGPVGPSKLLDGKIDNTFKEFLTGLATSTATTNQTGTGEAELIKLAQEALNSPVTFQRIKDLSLATNMMSFNNNEENIQVSITSDYKNSINLATNNEKSLATDTKPINTGASNKVSPGSAIKSKNDLISSVYQLGGVISLSTNQELVKTGITILEGTPSSRLNNTIQKSDLTGNNQSLGESIQSSGDLTGDGGLGTNITKTGLTGNVNGLGENIPKVLFNGGGGLGETVQGGNLSGDGGLGEKIQSVNFTGDGGLGTSIDKVDLNGNGGLGDKAEGGNLNGAGGLGNKVDGGNLNGTGGLGNKVEGGNLNGNGGLGNKAEGANLNGGGGLGSSIDKVHMSGNGGLSSKVEGANLNGNGGLGDKVEGANLNGDGGLGDTIEKTHFFGTGKLGDKVEGGNLNGTGGLGDKVEGANLNGDGGLGDKISDINLSGNNVGLQETISNAAMNETNVSSKATNEKLIDTNPIERPLPGAAENERIDNKNVIKQPEAGKATDNTI